MTLYSIKPGTRKYVKKYRFLSFARNLSDKYGKKYWILLQRQTRCAKTASKKLGHKTAEPTGEFIENKIAVKIVKPEPIPHENSRIVLI